MPKHDGLVLCSSLEELQMLISVPLHCLGLDDDTVIQKQELERWCTEARKSMEMKLSKPHKPNNQSQVERKNGVLICLLVSHHKSGRSHQPELPCYLCTSLSQFSNLCHPSSKHSPLKEGDMRKGLRPCHRHNLSFFPANHLLQQERHLNQLERRRLMGLSHQCDPVE